MIHIRTIHYKYLRQGSGSTRLQIRLGSRALKFFLENEIEKDENFETFKTLHFSQL
jgi:hypothetical protein